MTKDQNLSMKNKKQEILPQLFKELMQKFVKLANYLAIGYEQGSEYILHLFLNFGIIWFFIKIIIPHFESGSISQLLTIIVLVIHLIMWLCWLISEVLDEFPFDDEKEVLENV